jgi:hypothetical protein
MPRHRTEVAEGQMGGGMMKLRSPVVLRQIISVVFEGEPRECVIADWPEGEPLPAQVVTMIMDTWTPNGRGVEQDGSILYVQEHRHHGRGLKVERYPLIVVDQHRDLVDEVLYGVEPLAYFTRNGIAHVKVHCITDADGFPPRGQRHPAT